MRYYLVRIADAGSIPASRIGDLEGDGLAGEFADVFLGHVLSPTRRTG